MNNDDEKRDTMPQNEQPLSDDTPSVSSQDNTPSEPLTSFEPAPQDQNTDTSTAPTGAFGSPVTPSAPKKSRKGLIALIISIAAVLLLGGGAALAYFLWYQNPDKVVSDAFSSAFSAKSVEFKGSINVDSSADQTSGVKNVRLSFDGKSNNDAALIDAVFEVASSNGQTVKVDGSVVTSDKDIFVKVKNLENVLNIMLNAPEGESILNTPLGPLVKKVDGNWIKLSNGDLSDINEEYNKVQTCTSDLVAKVKKDKSYLNELGDVYKKNKFIVIEKSLGSKTVSGVDSIGFVVKTDVAKVKSFVKAVGDTKFGKEFATCDDSIDFNKMADEIKEADEKDGTATVEVWAARFGHQLTGINITSNDDTSVTALSSEFTFNKEVKIDTPTEALTIKDITEEYVKALQQAQGMR